jgi:hypothetical protein
MAKANKALMIPDDLVMNKIYLIHIALIFQYLKKLLNLPQPPRQKIGFKRKDEQ